MSLDSTFLLRSDGRSRYGGTWPIAAKPDKKRACRPFGPLYPRTYEARRADLRSRCERKKFRGRRRKTSGEAEKEK